MSYSHLGRGDPSTFSELNIIGNFSVTEETRKTILPESERDAMDTKDVTVLNSSYGERFFEVLQMPAAQQFYSLLFKGIVPVCDIVRTEDGRYWSKEFQEGNDEEKIKEQIQAEIVFLELFIGLGDRGVNFLKEGVQNNIVIQKKGDQFTRSFFDFEGLSPFVNTGVKNHEAESRLIILEYYARFPDLDLEYLRGLLLSLIERFDAKSEGSGDMTEGRRFFESLLKKSNFLEEINKDREFVDQFDESNTYSLFCVWVQICLAQVERIAAVKELFEKRLEMIQEELGKIENLLKGMRYINLDKPVQLSNGAKIQITQKENTVLIYENGVINTFKKLNIEGKIFCQFGDNLFCFPLPRGGNFSFNPDLFRLKLDVLREVLYSSFSENFSLLQGLAQYLEELSIMNEVPLEEKVVGIISPKMSG